MKNAKVNFNLNKYQTKRWNYNSHFKIRAVEILGLLFQRLKYQTKKKKDILDISRNKVATFAQVKDSNWLPESISIDVFLEPQKYSQK